jgi:predicted ArsR family transcriptional regulator
LDRPVPPHGRAGPAHPGGCGELVPRACRTLTLRAGKYLRHTDVVKNVRQAEVVTEAAGDARRPVAAAHGQVTPPLPGRGLPDTGLADAGLPETGLPGSQRPVSERGTRARVARLILENGPITASALSRRLGLTPAAVRRHLDALLADEMIEVRKARTYGTRGRGRPAKLFAINDAGRSAFEHAYDDLATSALRFIASKFGAAAVAEFAREQIADLEWRYRPVVEAAPPGERVHALAEALTADGYAASAGPTMATAPAGGQQLCQHHCPVAHVAAEFPQLCEAETEAFGRLLGTPVQRLATIAHGDGICTTHVTDPSLIRAASAAPAPAACGPPPASRPGAAYSQVASTAGGSAGSPPGASTAHNPKSESGRLRS